jgi:hypothetical protein
VVTERSYASLAWLPLTSLCDVERRWRLRRAHKVGDGGDGDDVVPPH